MIILLLILIAWIMSVWFVLIDKRADYCIDKSIHTWIYLFVSMLIAFLAVYLTALQIIKIILLTSQ